MHKLYKLEPSKTEVHSDLNWATGSTNTFGPNSWKLPLRLEADGRLRPFLFSHFAAQRATREPQGVDQWHLPVERLLLHQAMGQLAPGEIEDFNTTSGCHMEHQCTIRINFIQLLQDLNLETVWKLSEPSGLFAPPCFGHVPPENRSASAATCSL